MDIVHAVAIVIVGSLLGAGAYTLGFRSGYIQGREHAGMLKQADKLADCVKTPLLNHPQSVACPCMCDGILQADGRNKSDNLTFLICSRCKHRYVARDSADEELKRVS